MARESALWDRLKTGAKALRTRGVTVDIQRLENAVGTGHPDVEGCINGWQVWIELKSCLRPARDTTPVRPKKRESQNIWHKKRSEAGCRINWILIQVGEGHKAALYLVPGYLYDKIDVVEYELASLSVVPSNATPADVLLRAREGW